MPTYCHDEAVADHCEREWHDQVGNPGRRINEYRIFELDFQLQVAVGMPGDHRTDNGSEDVDDNPRELDRDLWKNMGQSVNSYVAIVARGGNRTDHRQPKDHELDEFVSPDEPGTENFPHDDLADRQQHHGREQGYEGRVLRESAYLVQPEQ